jgi:hypothetical protein
VLGEEHSDLPRRNWPRLGEGEKFLFARSFMLVGAYLKGA